MNHVKNFSLKKFHFTLFLLIGLLCNCSKEENINNDNEQEFELSSEDIDCSEDGSYLVPFAGKTYVINVTASDNVEWEVTSTGTLMNIKPEGKQKGNGTIELTAPENPEKETGHISTVVIQNSINSTKRTFEFEQKEKRLYFPEGSEGQSSEDFNNPSSTYNIYYMKEGDNVAILWDKNLGIKPALFDEDRALEEAEKAFRFLQNELGFASKSSNPANINKFLIFVKKENQSTAYGGGDNNVGKIWLGPNHLINSENTDRYGIFYHEMCHSFQYMAMFDGAPTFGGVGPFYEMTSQFAMVRKFPNWMELEPGHVNAFMKLTHLALGHEGNQYHAPWVLEYWENIRGPRFIPRLWEEANNNDNGDFIAVYKRLTDLSQEEFNDELFDAYRHFIAWDIPSIKEESKDYINKHSCKLNEDNNGFIISKNYCPQNYGYNAIKINTPQAGTNIKVTLMSMLHLSEYKVENEDEACWRLGFVAINQKGECIYSNMEKTSNNTTISYVVPENINNLWLVVMASPTKHHKHVIDNSLGTNQENRIYNQWPYKIILSNATIDNTFIE